MTKTTLIWPSKRPSEILDYGVDWKARLQGDTIAGVTFAKDGGTITLADESFDGTVSKVWVEGGATGETVVVTATVETAAGRVMTERVALKVD